MSTVTFTLNGKVVTGRSDRSILQAVIVGRLQQRAVGGRRHLLAVEAEGDEG